MNQRSKNKIYEASQCMQLLDKIQAVGVVARLTSDQESLGLMPVTPGCIRAQTSSPEACLITPRIAPRSCDPYSDDRTACVSQVESGLNRAIPETKVLGDKTIHLSYPGN
jgi:hypothetical protein